MRPPLSFSPRSKRRFSSVHAGGYDGHRFGAQKDCFCRRITTSSPARPNSRRKATSVNGPISYTAILIHRNDAPQTKPNTANAPNCQDKINTL